MFNSIQEVRDYISKISSEEFCRYERNNSLGKYCVLGHIDAALGDKYSSTTVGDDLLYRLSGTSKGWFGDLDFVDGLAQANNQAKDPKQGALDYLDHFIKTGKYDSN